MNNNKLLIIGMIIAMVLFLVSYFLPESYIITSIICFVSFIILVNRNEGIEENYYE